MEENAVMNVGHETLVYSVKEQHPSAVIKCNISGLVCNTLVDSGAGCSLIDKKLLDQMGAFNIQKTKKKWLDASENVIPILGTVTLPVSIIGSRHKKNVEFFISQSLSNLVILGRDFMEQFETVTFNIKKHWIKFENSKVRNRNDLNKERVRIQADTLIPARSEKVLAVTCRKEVAMIESMFHSKNILGHPGLQYMLQTL